MFERVERGEEEFYAMSFCMFLKEEGEVPERERAEEVMTDHLCDYMPLYG